MIQSRVIEAQTPEEIHRACDLQGGGWYVHQVLISAVSAPGYNPFVWVVLHKNEG